MWQKCPICNGTGSVPAILSTTSSQICTVCNGAKIISKLNGLPPANYSFEKSDKSQDFRDAKMESQQEYLGEKNK